MSLVGDKNVHDVLRSCLMTYNYANLLENYISTKPLTKLSGSNKAMLLKGEEKSIKFLSLGYPSSCMKHGVVDLVHIKQT